MKKIRESASAEFFVPPEYKGKEPTPELVSKIRVYLNGNKKPMSIKDFLLLSKDTSEFNGHCAFRILEALKKLMKEKSYKGSIIEFIYEYFADYNEYNDPLDVFAKDGVEVRSVGKSYNTKTKPTFDTNEIKRSEIAIKNRKFYKAKRDLAIGLEPPTVKNSKDGVIVSYKKISDEIDMYA